MARGKQLTQLVALLRDEIGQNANVAAGVDFLSALKNKIRQKQDDIYEDYDWPHLTIRPTLALAAGQRFYDFPTSSTIGDLNYEQIAESWVWFNGNPTPIERGISVADYGRYDPDADERLDPALKWDIQWTGTKEQIEVWPLPATNTVKLQFVGKRELRTLTADADVADIDDWLIVYAAAADFLMRRNKRDAELKLGSFRQRLSRLRGRAAGNSAPLQIGGGVSSSQANPRGRGTTIVISG